MGEPCWIVEGVNSEYAGPIFVLYFEIAVEGLHLRVTIR